MGGNGSCEVFEYTFEDNFSLESVYQYGKRDFGSCSEGSWCVLGRLPECGPGVCCWMNLFYLVGFPDRRVHAANVFEARGFQAW